MQLLKPTKLFVLSTCLLFGFAIGIFISFAQAGEKVVLATLDWEPYIGRGLKDQGYVAVVVREAFKRSGIDVEIQFHQWSRVIGLAKKGRVDGYFPEYYADSIKTYARFSDPIPAGPLGFFKRTDTNIDFTSLEALKGYRIGIVKGYINSREFDMADYLDKHPVKDDLSNLKLLLAGRVDLVVADKYVGHHLVGLHMPDQIATIKFLPRILEQKDIFVCISTLIPKTDYFLNAFNSGFRQMKGDHSLDALLPDFNTPEPPTTD